MRIILHPGWGKTGTSSIQTHFAAQRQANLDRYRFLYPANGTGLAGDAHHVFSLTWATIGGMSVALTPEAILSNLEGEIRESACDTVLLSSEIMPNVLAREEFADFVKRLDAKVSLIFTVRRQSALLNSLSNQLIRDMATDFDATPFATFLANAGYLDFMATIHDWLAPGLASEVLVVPYTRNIVQTFIRHVLPDAEAVSDLDNIQQNISLPHDRLSILLKIKKRLLELQVQMNCFPYLIDAIVGLPERCFSGHTPWFSATEQRLVDGYFRESNANLFERFGIDSDAFETEYRDLTAFDSLTRKGKSMLRKAVAKQVDRNILRLIDDL